MMLHARGFPCLVLGARVPLYGGMVGALRRGRLAALRNATGRDDERGGSALTCRSPGRIHVMEVSLTACPAFLLAEEEGLLALTLKKGLRALKKRRAL